MFCVRLAVAVAEGESEPGTGWKYCGSTSESLGVTQKHEAAGHRRKNRAQAGYQK